MRNTVYASFLCALLASHAAAQRASAPPASAAPPAPVKGATVEGISEYTLANGLRVLIFPDTSKATLTVNLTVLTGSRLEGYGETGMAHLLEHMLFKGSPRHTNPWAELQAHGAFFNGSTDYDRTNYFETVPASDENLEWALDLEADRLVASFIAPEALSHEFSVVRNEFESDENDPGEVLSERIWLTAYLWHNYGKSPIGSKSDIERVPADSLRRFYQRYYQPDNAVLVVSGRIDPEKALAVVNRKLGAIPRPGRQAALAQSYTVEPVQDGERLVTLRRAGDVQIVGIAYHALAGSDAAFPAEEAIDDLLTAQPSGRLYKALVKTGMATRVWADAKALAEPGLFEVYAEVRAGKPIEPVKGKMIQIVEGLSKNKPTDEEIARFKARFQKAFDLSMADSQGIAVELSEWAAQGDWRLLFVHRDRVARVSAADAAALAAGYFRPANRTVGLFLPTGTPERAPEAARPDVAALVKDYKGKDALAAGEEFESTYGNIEKRTRRVQLPGGLKLALLPKQTRGGTVIARLTLHFGSEKDLKGLNAVAGLVGPMLQRGTAKHTYQQLKDELDRLEARVVVGSELDSASVSVETVRANLPAVMALVAEMLQQPSFPADELDSLKKAHLAALEGQLSEPTAQAVVDLTRRLRPFKPDDVRYVPTTKESIDRLGKVTVKQVADFHRRFWGASNAEMAVVGDFDAGEVQALVARELGAWKSPRPYARVRQLYVTAAAADDTLDTPDKEGGFVVMGHLIELRDDDPDFPALELINFVLGGGASSRMFERLRQKEGWSYGVGTTVDADSFEKVAYFGGYALCAPQNAAKAREAMVEEIKRMVEGGMTADELKVAREGILRENANLLADDSYVAEDLRADLFIGRTLDFDQKQLDAIARLSLDEVNRVIKKNYIKPDKLVRVLAADQKKANAGGAK